MTTKKEAKPQTKLAEKEPPNSAKRNRCKVRQVTRRADDAQWREGEGEGKGKGRTKYEVENGSCQLTPR